MRGRIGPELEGISLQPARSTIIRYRLHIEAGIACKITPGTRIRPRAGMLSRAGIQLGLWGYEAPLLPCIAAVGILIDLRTDRLHSTIDVERQAAVDAGQFKIATTH